MATLAHASVAAAVALALTVTGCDGGTAPDEQRRTLAETSGTTTSTTAGDGAVAAYTAWVDALARHDAAAACALQAPELTIELRYDAILADRAELGDPCAAFEALLWEDPEFRGEVVDVSVTQATEEDAVLEATLGPGEETSRTVRMVHHRARWRVLSTEDRSDGGPGPARWVARWCRLSPDQTRDQVVALMGEPSGEYTVADGGEPQLWWAQDQYDFRVYLDPVDDSILELVGDYDALGADDRALLSCPELRR